MTAVVTHLAGSVPLSPPSSASPEPQWLHPVGGIPGTIAIAVAIAVPLSIYLFEDSRRRKRDAAQHAAYEEDARDLERIHIARIKAERQADDEKRRTAQWRLSVQILKESLFAGQPDDLSNELTAKVLGRIDERLPSRDDLVLATRLVIERWLLDTVRSRASVMTTVTSAHAICGELLSIVDDVLQTRHTPKVVELETSYMVEEFQNRQPNAATYLRALARLAAMYEAEGTIVPNSDCFITRIRIKDGFVAPAYHIESITHQLGTSSSGAFSQFKEVHGETSLQDFNFLSWLLFGGSIPVCTCKRWEGDFKVLQYGYDDETSSFPLILEEKVFDESWERIRSELLRISGDHLPLAIGSEFVGRIVWGPRYHRRSNEFPLVFSVKDDANGQQLHLKYQRELPRRSLFDGIMLLAESIERLPSPRRMYRSHLWVLFEVCREDGRPVYQNRSERWRALYPILEEANLADGPVLISLKNALAQEAMRQVEEFERISPGKRLRYLCAFDDPGSVKNGDLEHNFALIVHPHSSAGHEPVGENRLRTLLGHMAPERLFVPATERTKIITACDLPQIVADFCRELSNHLNVPRTHS